MLPSDIFRMLLPFDCSVLETLLSPQYEYFPVHDNLHTERYNGHPFHEYYKYPHGTEHRQLGFDKSVPDLGYLSGSQFGNDQEFRMYRVLIAVG
jgi:hypothetical protein